LRPIDRQQAIDPIAEGGGASRPRRDLLAGVETLDSAGFRGLDALAVDNRRTRRGFPADLLAAVHQQRCPDPRPDAELPELAKIAVDRRTGREARRQQTPLTTAPQHVKDRVQHLAQARRPRSTARLGRRQEWLDQRELGVRQVGCVAATEALILTAGGIGPHGDSSSFLAEQGVS
jgi:hypothetical protein